MSTRISGMGENPDQNCKDECCKNRKKSEQAMHGDSIESMEQTQSVIAPRCGLFVLQRRLLIGHPIDRNSGRAI
jgi:hypothetical protein